MSIRPTPIKTIFNFIFVCFFVTAISCSPPTSIFTFRNLSPPEKRWVLFHPFVAAKARKITEKARSETKALRQDPRLDGDENGGQLDAFRHAYWMALLSQKFCWKKARSLGRAHEKGNFIDFKRHRMEDGILPDSVASVMDLKNNESGVWIGRENKMLTTDSLKEVIVKNIMEGQLYIIRKNEHGKFLNCQGEVIDTNLFLHRWNIPKCLVPSNQKWNDK